MSEDVTYADYLRLPELLALQVPLADGVDDELLFIAVHQVQELWFGQLLRDLSGVRDRMLEGDPRAARAGLVRSTVITRALIAGIHPLRGMPPREFHAFRGALGGSSGAQSAQYLEIAGLCGAEWVRGEHGARAVAGLGALERERMRGRLAEPTVWEAFVSLLAKAGFAVGTAQERREAFGRLAAAPRDGDPVEFAELSELVEALVDHDEIWTEWRACHALLVERQIGGRPGTGGSSGVAHLRAAVHRRFYPELWEARDAGIPPLPAR
ncbi:tryptophan 2,3-dioxygenase family protein [Streptomyces lavendulae]|uniref:tryptophan 2,3-dioxygenase family protein n=1 Tax=Streptomyces lavendulae TaxID=1914 RepID=UPI0024A1B3A2|nr:tryptophan 2,3-dioxygenase [Streptomyces roseochromogenus]